MRPKLLICLLALVAIVGCGDDDDGGGGGAKSPGRGDIRIEFAMVGIPGDPFYNVIKNGARQAERDLGVDVEYKETAQYDFQEQKRLIEAAIARKPDGLVISNESPDVSVFWWLALTAIATVVLAKTRFGNWIFGAGGDPEAARKLGVPVARVKIVLAAVLVNRYVQRRAREVR